MTTKKACGCKNEYQDQKYGVGIRLMNYLQKAGKALNSVRCTVCGTVRDA